MPDSNQKAANDAAPVTDAVWNRASTGLDFFTTNEDQNVKVVHLESGTELQVARMEVEDINAMKDRAAVELQKIVERK